LNRKDLALCMCPISIYIYFVAEKSHLNYREGDKAEMGHATEEMGVGTDSPWTEEPGGLQSMGSQESDTT